MKQQMENVYEELGRILAHHGLTVNDVIVENVFTTDILKVFTASTYRNSIYKTQLLAGSWLEFKVLARPESTKALKSATSAT